MSEEFAQHLFDRGVIFTNSGSVIVDKEKYRMATERKGKGQEGESVPTFEGYEGLRYSPDPKEIRQRELLKQQKEGQEEIQENIADPAYRRQMQERNEALTSAARSGGAIPKLGPTPDALAKPVPTPVIISQPMADIVAEQPVKDILPKIKPSPWFGRAASTLAGVALGIFGAKELENSGTAAKMREAAASMLQKNNPVEVGIATQQATESVSSPTPTPDAPTLSPVEPTGKVDPTAQALIKLNQEQRNLILTDTKDVKLDSELGQITLIREGIKYRFDPAISLDNPESGLVAMDGQATSKDGSTTVSIDNMWNTRTSDKLDPFKALEIKNQDAVQAIADLYAELASLGGNTGTKNVRFVISGEDIGTAGDHDPDWQVLVKDGNRITIAVKKGQTGNQRTIMVYTNNLGLPKENRTRWLYTSIVNAAIEDASPELWKSPNEIQKVFEKYKIGTLRDGAIAPIN